MLRFLLICLGGAVGTGLRYLTATVGARWLGPDFPWGTMIVNLTGAFAIGFVQQLGASALVLSDTTRLVLATGVMGGLTTYSAFSYETVRLAQGGGWLQAAMNVVVTTTGCLVLCFLGIAVARLLVTGR